MKRKSLKLAISFILVMIVSCDEPETVVTDVVHPDGSVTRKIEMRNMENKFKIKDIQIPFDSTWTVRDSLEIDKKGDTTWVKRAEKFFVSTDELNKAYQADSGNNREISRRAEFRKKFKWFNTEYKFAEIIDKELPNNYFVTEFLNQEELNWFYSPTEIKHGKLSGPDSLKYKALNDTVSKKSDRWVVKCLASEWITSFVKLTEGKAGNDLTVESLKKREDDLVKLAEINDEKFDSLWNNGIILKEFLGEANALKFKTEADSAANLSSERVFISFHNYQVRIVMPGKLTGTNGFIDSTGIMLWPVQSEYFLTQPYEMWAESKTSNKWTWIVSGVFILFVIAGIIFRSIKKG
ncbi:MAG: hypothetical protein NTZ85_12670 [Bacteroidia bacterium]|nr:hypothetical protein [Bacteroidia bacterium]